MFTIFKVRDKLADYDKDPGWYDNPPGTVAGPEESVVRGVKTPASKP